MNYRIIFTILCGAGAFILYVLYKIGYLRKGNAEAYSVKQTLPLEDPPLGDKTLYFMGSSVTYGFAAHAESFVDFIAKRNSCKVVKNAISGTTMRDSNSKSFVRRMAKFPTDEKVDAFVCQLSTNDAHKGEVQKYLGEISPGKEIAGFDISTSTGAMEYMIQTAKEKWNCPVIFYTDSKYDNPDYLLLIKRLYELQKKWDLEIIDLYNSDEINSITAEKKKSYMLPDYIHPLRIGYKLWWTPYIERRLTEILNKKDLKQV